MTFSVKMPALGESVTEGTVTRWLKAEGDHINVDEPLLEVSTDKVDTEIPSPVSGTLSKILVQIDATVPVGADLAIIEDGAAAPAPVVAAPVAAPTPPPVAAPAAVAPVAPVSPGVPCEPVAPVWPGVPGAPCAPVSPVSPLLVPEIADGAFDSTF